MWNLSIIICNKSLFPSFSKMGVNINIVFHFNLQGLQDTFFYYPTLPEADIGIFAVRYKQYKAHFLTEGNSNSGSNNHDQDCRPSAVRKSHAPPLVYDLDQDPSEQFVLDHSTHRDIYNKLYQIKVDYEASMTWAVSEISKPMNNTYEPCCNPGCKPFPSCCVCQGRSTPVIKLHWLWVAKMCVTHSLIQFISNSI